MTILRNRRQEQGGGLEDGGGRDCEGDVKEGGREGRDAGREEGAEGGRK